jgi:phage terminase large subunit GpA-like protein
MKTCPHCGSNELEWEPAAEPVGDQAKLADSISYVCLDCGCEFLGISGKGCVITSEGVEGL